MAKFIWEYAALAILNYNWTMMTTRNEQDNEVLHSVMSASLYDTMKHSATPTQAHSSICISQTHIELFN